MKSLPFEVNMVDSNGETYKVTALYKPWVNTVKVEEVEAIALTAAEIELIKNPVQTQEL